MSGFLCRKWHVRNFRTISQKLKDFLLFANIFFQVAFSNKIYALLTNFHSVIHHEELISSIFSYINLSSLRITPAICEFHKYFNLLGRQILQHCIEPSQNYIESRTLSSVQTALRRQHENRK